MILNCLQKLLMGLLCLSATHVQAQDLLNTYELGVENDPVLKESLANLYAVNESRPQSIARLLPDISFGAASGRERLFNAKESPDSNGNFRGGGTQNYWNNNLSINLTQPIFHWDHWVQLSQSDNQIAQAEADYLAEQQNLMVRITEAYFNVLSAQDSLEFTVAEKKAIARQLEQSQQRFEVGLIAITDVYEAQAGFDQARASEITAINEVDNSKEALGEIIGISSVDLSKLGEQSPLVKPSPEDISIWSTTAEKQNLVILAAQNGAELAQKTIELQRSGHYPQLDVVGSTTFQDNTSSFGLRGDTQSIALQLNIPLFEGGAVNSRTRQAHQEYIQAKEQLIAAKRSVKRQVRDAYRGVISSISSVQALEAAVKSARSALEATEAGFEVGTRTMVDVLAEQRNLFRRKRDHSKTRYDYLVNSIKLKQAASTLNRGDLEQINLLLL